MGEPPLLCAKIGGEVEEREVDEKRTSEKKMYTCVVFSFFNYY